MPPKVYKQFAEYLEDQNESCMAALKELRQYIPEFIPYSEELFNHNIPAFNLIPGGKGSVQFTLSENLPNELIIRMIQ